MRALANALNDKNKFNSNQYKSSGLSQQQIVSIKQDFDKLDVNKTGSLNPRILKDMLQSKGPQTKSKGIYQLIHHLDSQGHGNITFQQFLHLNTPRLVPEDSHYNINSIFKLFDDQKTGYLSVKSLRRKAHELGLDIQQQDFQDMIKIVNKNNNGKVSEEEFYQFVIDAQKC